MNGFYKASYRKIQRSGYKLSIRLRCGNHVDRYVGIQVVIENQSI